MCDHVTQIGTFVLVNSTIHVVWLGCVTQEAVGYINTRKAVRFLWNFVGHFEGHHPGGKGNVESLITREPWR